MKGNTRNNIPSNTSLLSCLCRERERDKETQRGRNKSTFPANSNKPGITFLIKPSLKPRRVTLQTAWLKIIHSLWMLICAWCSTCMFSSHGQSALNITNHLCNKQEAIKWRELSNSIQIYRTDIWGDCNSLMPPAFSISMLSHHGCSFWTNRSLNWLSLWPPHWVQ